MKYIYFFKYQENEIDLCALEFKILFNDTFHYKTYITDIDFDYTRSVYIKGKLTVLYSSKNLNDIIHHIKNDQLTYYDFKMMYLKNDITHIEYQDSLDAINLVCVPIQGSVNFKEPKVKLALTYINDTWYFGEYENELTWSLRMHKPHSYSHSLNTRDARTLVNLAMGHCLNQTLVDPCCGVGTVVLEALSMGVNIEGYDINRYVAYQARLNLEHFHYNPLIVNKKDMKVLDKKYDCCIMDIPYGVYSPFTYSQQLELISSTIHFTKRLVLVTHINMNKELQALGYTIENQCTITKGSFTRYITIANL